MKTVRYTEREKDIVARGIAAVADILLGEDQEAKESLLLCLDYYMDPYYGQTLDYERELADLLQTVIISPNPLSVKEDALQLLTSYSYPPFSLLAQGLEQVEPELRPDVIYALNMAREEAALTALLAQCASIMDSMAEAFAQMESRRCGDVPASAVVKYCEGGDSEPSTYFKNQAMHTWKLEQGRYTIADNALSHQRQPESGMFFYQAAFWVSFDPETWTAYLIYQFGPRFGRSFTYDLTFPAEGGARLENEHVVWVS